MSKKTSSLWHVMPDQLCDRVRETIRRARGRDTEVASRVYYSHGWYYVGIARKFPDGSIGLGGVLPSALRRSQVIELIGRLQKERAQ